MTERRKLGEEAGSAGRGGDLGEGYPLQELLCHTSLWSWKGSTVKAYLALICNLLEPDADGL